MIRRPFTFVSAASLLICVALLWLWFTGYWRGTEVHGFHRHLDGQGWTQYRLLFEGGGVAATFQSSRTNLAGASDRTFQWFLSFPRPAFEWNRAASIRYPTPQGGVGLWRDAGFEFHRASRSASMFAVPETITETRLVFPCWLAFILTGALPAAWCMRWKRTLAAREANHCTHCGYDLRASKDRCPECGTPIPDGSGAPS